MRLSEVEAWMLTSQNEWKSFIELKSRNVEFQVEECIFFKVSPWEKGEELRQVKPLFISIVES